MNRSEKKLLTNHKNTQEFYLRIMYGLKEILRHKWKLVFPTMYVLILAGILHIIFHLYSPMLLLGEFSQIIHVVMFTIFILVGLCQILVTLGTPSGTRKIQESFLRIRFTNKAGEVPLLLAKYKNSEICIMEFASSGIPLAEWAKKSDEISSILNCHVAKIEVGKSPKYILLHTASSNKKLPRILEWNDNNLVQDGFTLVLGKNLLGNVTIDLIKTPHVLLGGSSGSGKSVLLKLLLMQCIKKDAQIYIADFKGGVDYAPTWHDKCFLIYHENEMLEILSHITDTLEKRKELFRNSHCSDIDSFNAQTKNNLPRIILACDEIAEVLDKTGLSKERKEQISVIESHLSIIARQGRAFGIHLILATQRPSADILSGQIKNNIDVRICGRADSVLSQIILDNTDASTKIPKDKQGQFITNSGEVFQSFWFDDKDF